MKRAIGILLVALALVACGDAYDRQLRWLTWYIGLGKIGSSPDQWLVKRTFGVDDRVALMFGYMDDFAGCYDIAEMLNERYPGTDYVCRPAN